MTAGQKVMMLATLLNPDAGMFLEPEMRNKRLLAFRSENDRSRFQPAAAKRSLARFPDVGQTANDESINCSCFVLLPHLLTGCGQDFRRGVISDVWADRGTGTC
jgi:hypothetical protein